MKKLKLLDLFSGIGGFSLGLERTGGFETVAFCEYDEKAQKVLKKHWPDVPIYKDVRTLDYEGSVDVITGGYPCQPFSFAGKRKGTKDDRHLWPSMFSLIQKHRPSWVIGENVAGHINMGLDNVLADLESEGYGTRTFVIPACSVNAPHRRDRVWIVGYSEHDGPSSCGTIGELQGEQDGTQTTIFEFEGASEPTTSMENTRHRTRGSSEQESVGRNGKRKHETEVGSSGTVKVARSSKASDAVADTNMQRCKQPSQARNDGKDRPKSNDKQFRGCCTTHRSNQNSPNTNSIIRQAQYERKVLGEQSKEEQTEGLADAYLSADKQWEAEPSVGRLANGIPNRVDRLKQLGNAVVPQIPEIIGNAILEVEGEA